MKPSEPLLLLCCGLLFFSSCGKSPEAKWRSFQEAFSEGHRDLIVANETTPEQWEKALRGWSDADVYAAQALALAKAQPKSDLARDELFWVIAYGPETPSCRESIEIYSRDYSDRFPLTCSLIERHNAWEDHFFRVIFQESPNRQMRGQALLARARFRQSVMHDNATAENLFQQVIAQFSDVNVETGSIATLGELAQEDVFSLRNPGRAGTPARAGAKVPRFKSATTDGKSVQMPDGYKGKLVLIDFWATWCVPCVKEIPNVVAAYDKYHAKGLEILSVSLDQRNAGRLVANFTQKHHMPWPQIYDGKYLETPLAIRFGVAGVPLPSGIPHAFLVDGDSGLIVAEGQNARGAKLAAAIEGALAKQQQTQTIPKQN